MMEIPQQDERLYRATTIASHDLDCLLISDPQSDKAAAALSVSVGQLHDPPNFPGLAHLTEHMLFLGTQEFPQENEYDRYLSQHGGHSNAYTDLELTCYYCDCQADALEGALARFGACLTGPLIQADSLEREIQAVDSEHAKNKQQDHWRSHQLSKSVLGGGLKLKDGQRKHPYAGFGSGNLDVLLPKLTVDTGSSDQQERDDVNKMKKSERIKLLREQVVAFYERYYKTQNMKLVVLGRESIDQLEKMAERYFGRVPKGSSDSKANFRPDPLPPLPLQPTLVHWVPVRESRTLELQWALPEQRSLYRLKPARYLSHLLGHEGPGSLLMVLRDLQWAQELSADDVSKATSAFTVFSLQIELTALGFEHINEIIQMVYVYIGLLDKIPSWVYEELAETAEMQFRFLSKQEPSDTVSTLAVNMQHHAVEHYLSGPYKIYDYDPLKIVSCWKCLHPDNMVVMISAKDFEKETDLTDPWYGTQYRILSREKMIKIQELARDPSSAKSLTDRLALPERNDMLATEFGLVETPYDCFKSTEAVPRCIFDRETCRVWYKPDTTFRMPKVNAMFLLRSPMVNESPRQAVLASLWTEVVHEFCNAFSYVAYMAGLHCDFTSNHSGIEITVSGYNHKAGVLLLRICKAVTDMPAKLTSEVFDRILDKLQKRYLAFLVAQPYQHAINASDLCLEVYKWSVQDRLSSLHELTPDDLIGFHKQLLSRFHLEALVHGNVSANTAIDWTNVLLNEWKPKPLLYQNSLRVVSLPGDTIYRFAGWNPEDDNSCAVSLFQIGPIDLKVNATLSLILHLIREPAFNQLRTEEQLGYIVHTSIKTNGERVKGLLILIQSDGFDPVHVDERIEAFLVQFRDKIVRMSEETMQTNVNAVCQSLLEKNKNLYEESSKHWTVITNRSYHFHRLQDIAAEAKHLTKFDVLRFYDKYLMKGSPYRRKLTVHIYGCNHKDKLKEQEAASGDDSSVHLVRDPKEFSRNQLLFPVQGTLSVEDHTLKI